MTHENHTTNDTNASKNIISDELTGSRFARPEGYARRLGCSKRNVQRLMQRGVLPFIKTGHRTVLIPLQEADAALLKLAVGGTQKGAATR